MTAKPQKYLAPAAPVEAGGVLLDHYRIEEVLGAVGSVWYAKAVYEFAPQIAYSIQILPWSQVEGCPLREDFLSEGERLTVVQTPPYVPVMRHGVTEDGHGVIVREYLAGQGLYDLSNLESFSTIRCMRAVECVARAMAMGHREGYAMHGFTHHDVRVNGEKGRLSSAAHILNAPYPIGARCHDDVRVHGYLSRYHAPEFREHRVASVASDVFSLGMLMSILLLGDRHKEFLADPYNFDFEELEGFRVVLLRSLTKDVQERISTIDEFILGARESARDVMRLANDASIPTRESRVFARRHEVAETLNEKG